MVHVKLECAEGKELPNALFCQKRPWPFPSVGRSRPAINCINPTTAAVLPKASAAKIPVSFA
jgi:hypothetical protein